MVVTIRKVVDEVSRYGVDTIPDGTTRWTFSSSCKICFQRWSTSVELTAYICVIGPAITESLLKLAGKGMEWWHFSCWFHSQLEPLKLQVKDHTAEHPLNYISPIQAVHAISSHIPSLSLEHGSILRRVEMLPHIIPCLELGYEMPVSFHLSLDDINQFWEIFPFHIFAFTMEVKPDIL